MKLKENKLSQTFRRQITKRIIKTLHRIYLYIFQILSQNVPFTEWFTFIATLTSFLELLD